MGVPGVLPDAEVHYVEWDILFWLTQVLGSCCFIAASLLFMLETQPNWWHIQPFNLGWQVGFWNLWLLWILAVPCRDLPEVGHCTEHILGRMGFLAGLLHPAVRDAQLSGSATVIQYHCHCIGSYTQLL